MNGEVWRQKQIDDSRKEITRLKAEKAELLEALERFVEFKAETHNSWFADGGEKRDKEVAEAYSLIARAKGDS